MDFNLKKVVTPFWCLLIALSAGGVFRAEGAGKPIGLHPVIDANCPGKVAELGMKVFRERELRVLFVGHTEEHARAILKVLSDSGYWIPAGKVPVRVATHGALEIALKEDAFDLVIFAGGDSEAENTQGINRIKSRASHIPRIVISPTEKPFAFKRGWAKAGAQDFLTIAELPELAERLEEHFADALRAKKLAEEHWRQRTARREQRTARRMAQGTRNGATPVSKILSTMLTSSMVAAYTMDAEGTFTFTNAHFLDLLGFRGPQTWAAGDGHPQFEQAFPPPDGLLNKQLSTFCMSHSHLGTNWMEKCFSMTVWILRNNKRVLETGRVFIDHEPMVHADGSVHEMKVLKFPIWSEFGISSVGTVVLDLTAQALSSLTQGIFDRVSDGAVAFDENGNVFLHNHPAKRIFGSALRTGASALSVVGAAFADKGQFDAAMAVVRATGFWDGDLTLPAEPEPVVLEAKLELIPDGVYGKPVVFFTAKDVSGHRAFAKLVEDLSKMSALGESIGFIQHEIKNILDGVVKSAQLLVSLLADPKSKLTPPEMSEVLNEIVAAALVGDQMARRMMSIASGKPGEKYDFPARDAIKLLSGHARPFNRGGLTITTLPYEGNAYVHAEFLGLYNALLNFGSNAIHQQMNMGGEIVYSLKEITIDGKLHVQYSVKDRAGGIPVAIRERIFDKTYSSGKEGGTGFGLAMAKMGAEAAGATLELKVEDGVGSEFILTMPAFLKAENLPELKPAVTEDYDILLVDDDATSLRLTKRLLEFYGYKVAVAKDAESLKSVLSVGAQSIRVVYLDFNLSDMTNQFAFTQISATYPEAKIYMVTGQGTENDDMAAAYAGKIMKPFNPEDHRKTLRLWIPGKDTGAVN